MAFIRKPIDIISPADSQHYTSITQYERALDSKGQHIMSDNEYKLTKEKIMDEMRSAPKKKEEYNHVHIDFANGKVEKSRRDLDV